MNKLRRLIKRRSCWYILRGFYLLSLQRMNKKIAIFFFFFWMGFFTNIVNAQCSICTKTAQQLGEKPAQGLNSGILYLMFTPFILVGVIGYRWWKNNKEPEGNI
jgi:hypothetical protein